MRTNVIKSLGAVAAALVLGITGFLNLNQGTAQAQGLNIGNLLGGIISIGSGSANACDYNSVDSIVTAINNSNGSDTDVTVTQVINALGGSLTGYQRTHCDNNNGNRGNNRGLPIYNSCDDYWSHGLSGIRRGTSNYNSRLDTLNRGVICDRDPTPDVQVTGNADCTVSQDNDRTYGLRLNRGIDDYNRLLNDARRSDSPGGVSITDSERREIERNRSLVDQYRTPYSNNLGVLRVDCNQQQSNVTINNQLPDTSSTTTTIVQAPAPTTSYGSTVPQGHAETGDGSNSDVDAG
jgi:hypothetical protein